MDSVITVTTTGDSNSGKYYTSGENWRLYYIENPVITVSANGATIISVKFTYASEKNGVMTYNGATITSGQVVAINATSATFGVNDTVVDNNNGQARVTAIEVKYEVVAGTCEHEYTDCADAVCDKCNETTRTAPGHQYAGCTATACDNCTTGTRTAPGHAYTNEYDATCNNAGCTTGNRTATALPAAGSELTYDVAEKIALAQGHNNYTANKYILKGEITEVKDATYGNVYIKDASGKTFYIYGLYTAAGVRYDAMTTKPAAGDTITVSAGLGQYNGTAQMKNATLVEEAADCEHEYTNDYDTSCNECGAPRTAPEALPEADTALTYDVAEKVGLAQGHNSYTTGKYYLTGEITEITNEQYGNMKIKDASGKIFTVYGLYSADGSVRFDAMTTKPAVGDTITVYGVLGQYNGGAQMKNAWLAEEPAATADNTPVVALITLCVLSAAAFVTMTSLKKREF